MAYANEISKYAAGNKRYGGGRDAPNVGMALDPVGYRERDRKAAARRNAMLRRLQQQQRGQFMAPNYLRRDTL